MTTITTEIMQAAERLPSTIENLVSLGDAGMALSYWASSINLKLNGTNTPEWIEGLVARISVVQKLHESCQSQMRFIPPVP